MFIQADSMPNTGAGCLPSWTSLHAMETKKEFREKSLPRHLLPKQLSRARSKSRTMQVVEVLLSCYRQKHLTWTRHQKHFIHMLTLPDFHFRSKICMVKFHSMDPMEARLI